MRRQELLRMLAKIEDQLNGSVDTLLMKKDLREKKAELTAELEELEDEGEEHFEQEEYEV
jgi:phosphate uptake regulator